MVLKEKRTGIEKQFYDLCGEVVNEQGYDLYDLDYFPRNQELRVFIMDRETGSAVIEDCVKVDAALTPHIDELDWMPDQLRLEVSSPGVFRTLNTLEHFQGCLGEKIELQLKEKLALTKNENLPKKLDGQKKIRVLLKELAGESILVSYNDFELSLKFEQIKKANMSPDL